MKMIHINRDKTDFVTKVRMLGLPASVKAPALAATSGRTLAQLIAPWLGGVWAVFRRRLGEYTFDWIYTANNWGIYAI